jgi:hypothetical protein
MSLITPGNSDSVFYVAKPSVNSYGQVCGNSGVLNELDEAVS